MVFLLKTPQHDAMRAEIAKQTTWIERRKKAKRNDKMNETKNPWGMPRHAS